MTRARYSYLVKIWSRNCVSLKALSAILGAMGSLWSLVKITTFFFEKTSLPDKIQEHWLVFLLIGCAIAAVRCKPRLSVEHKLNGRDITIEIAIGNLFSFQGAFIIGTNTTFDTQISNSLISERSIQGIFTRRYYKNESLLDEELSSSLNGIQSTSLANGRLGKSERYPMGTVVRLNPEKRTAYFLAIADLNEHGVASGTFDELKDSLAKLWIFVGSHGSKEPLVMPVLGSGFARLTQPREQIVREIVKSFVAACSEKSFCDKLTIVLAPPDVNHYNLSLDALGAFVQHVCEYTDFSQNQRKAIGTPV